MLKTLLTCLVIALTSVSCAPPQPPANADAAATASADSSKPDASTEDQSTGSVERGPVLAHIVKRGTLRVGTSGDQAPFTMKDRQGKPLGLEIDLAYALGRALELEVEFVTLPFGQLLPAVESGRVDIALSSITMTPKRNMDVAFVGPYFVSGKALLTKDGNLTKIEDPAGLDRMQMRLAALRGSTSEQLIKRAAPTATLVLFDRYDDAVAAVAEDKVNALVADLPLIAVTLAQYPEAGFAAVGDALSFEPIGAAVPAYDAHFQNLIGNYFRLLEGIGVLEALRQRWFGNADWLQALPPQTFGKPLDPSAGYAL